MKIAPFLLVAAAAVVRASPLPTKATTAATESFATSIALPSGVAPESITLTRCNQCLNGCSRQGQVCIAWCHRNVCRDA
ncbi:Uu.00g068550.m01.CDS01 [Anthostomella pinea]|uniref:Uu.00g068550.m01.CDS01 n=1 Tax=Anthostomella pinea TaxID=933095 RepID=A0AAI8VUZ6_9PEZI|nr:Uu.00g068550.m01.CDS01 [Anthostomella pinea]